MRSKSKRRQEERTPPAKPGSASHPVVWRENFSSIVVTAILFLFFTTFTAQAFVIPSGSMENTLQIGDRPFADNVSLAPRTTWLGPLLPYSDVHRGDIIIFLHPAESDRKHMVKRVIGVPGDRIRIVRRSVMVNGHFIVEPYKVHKAPAIDDYADNFPSPPNGMVYPSWREEMPHHINAQGELVLPENRYFVMGDNRDNSNDSRFWGFVPREAILGRPFVVYWSLERTEKDYEKNGGGDRIGDAISLLLSLPRDTRWDRLFRTFPRVNP